MAKLEPMELDLILSPEEAYFSEQYLEIACKKAGLSSSSISGHRIIRKSIDARKAQIKVNMRISLYTGDSSVEGFQAPVKINVDKAQEVYIVGMGPAGLFAAIRLIELGLKPVILEKGVDVSQRKRDIARINQNKGINTESNYCFGEGGAGTFSDGKLYTRSKKRGNTSLVLQWFRYFGADESVLYEAHPHIGTDKLPAVIRNMRNYIIESGGQVVFGADVQKVVVKNNELESLHTKTGEKFEGGPVILATGHSARDIYFMLNNAGIYLESKDFAMGVRVEHPQDLINSIQYHSKTHSKYLPAATYNLVTQAKGKGVFSFCMCPGGFIVPAATAEREIVVNGMSPAKRNSPYANSGIVVSVHSGNDPMAALKMQESLERMAFEKVNAGLTAPAQRLSDFMNGKLSSSLPNCSYNPGIVSSNLAEWLPKDIGSPLKEAFGDFGRKMRGFITSEALIVGVESRTSSPVRIPRDRESLQHPQVKGLFPCGEGSGYAGGITSSAVDGINCAEKVAEMLS